MRKLFLLFLLVSCGDDRFPRVEALKDFRILAIQATNSEVAPGQTSTLSLFVSDVEGGGRPITGTYEACVDPGISTGASVSCDHDPNRESGPYLIDTRVPDLANNLYTGFSGSATVTVPGSILDGRSFRERSNGVAYIVVFRFDVDGKTVTAFKRIIATNRGSLNQNPLGALVQLNGLPIGTIPGKNDSLTVSNLVPETYSFVNVDGSSEIKTEALEVGWYVSEGEIDKAKADYGETVKYLDGAPASLLLVAVIRDDRGGVEVVRFFR